MAQILGSAGPISTFGQSLDTSSNATVYSKRFSGRHGNGVSVHLEFAGGSSLTTAATLWASDKPEPDEANDNDWVQQTDVTFTGITTGTSAKELKTIGNANSKWYRVKLVTSNGSGKASCWQSGRFNQRV